MQVYRMHNLQLDYHTQTIFYSIEILNKAYHYFKLAAAGKYEPAKEALKQLLKSGFSPSRDSLSKKDIQSALKQGEETTQLMNPNWDLDFYDFDKNDKKEDLINEGT